MRGPHTSEWIRSKVAKAIDSLLLKGKVGFLPNWHGIQSNGLEETEPNRPLDIKVLMRGREAWPRQECHNSMEVEAATTGAETDEEGRWREASLNSHPTIRAVQTIYSFWESYTRQPQEEKNRLKQNLVSWSTNKRLRCSLGTKKRTSKTDKLEVEMEPTWLIVMVEPSAMVIVGKIGRM